MYKRVWWCAVLLLVGADRVMADPLSFEIRAFEVVGNTLLDAATVQATLQPFTGPGRAVADVTRAAEMLRMRYQAAGYTVVQVMAPEQVLTGGVVKLKVQEDRVTAIEVQGNKQYSADNIRASLPVLVRGNSLNAKQLEAAISLANENAAKQVAVNVQPGSQPGDLIARVDVSEDRLSRWMVGMDNTGAAATGYAKLNVAYQHANLFDRDHALALQYTASPDALDKIGSVNLGYHLPLYPSGVSLDFIAAYSSSATQNGAIYFSGKGSVLGARLNYPLPTLGDWRHKVILGADYKANTNSFTACTAPCGSVTERPFSLAYAAQLTKPSVQGAGSVTWVSNLPGGSQGSYLHYQAARATVAGATLLPTPNWRLWRANVSGSVSLPLDWQMRAALNGQYSRDLLLPAEQLGVGGMATVRGYPERVVAGERGYYGNLELYTPDLNQYWKLPDDSVRALLFWDTARVSVNDQPLAWSHSAISSYGIGVRVVHRRDVTVKLDLGWPQQSVPYLGSVIKKNDVRGHIAISLVF